MSVDESLKQNFESINTAETNRMIYEVLIPEELVNLKTKSKTLFKHVLLSLHQELATYGTCANTGT